MSKPNVSEKLGPQHVEHRRGNGSVFLRGQTYWIRYWRRGEQFRESSQSTNPDKARKLLDRRMKEIWAERQGLSPFNPKAERVYVGELLDELEKYYKLRQRRGIRQFTTHLKPIRDAFGGMRAVDLTKKRVDDYIDRRLEEEGRSPGTNQP